MLLKETTGRFHWSEAKAHRMAKLYSMIQQNNGNPFHGLYCTSVKGEPANPNRPHECWAITNKYDPRVIIEKKKLIALMATEYTSLFWWTEEQIDRIVKKYSSKEAFAHFYGLYCTGVKGEPMKPDRPDECWAVTNRYDPRVIANRKKNV